VIPKPRQSERPRAGARSSPGRPAAAARRCRIARGLARNTLLAAGLVAAQFGIPEIDPRFQVFDRTLVDRLQAPISRHHE